MNKKPEYRPINLKRTLAKMKAWAREKDRIYLEQKKLAEKMFGPLIKKLKLIDKVDGNQWEKMKSIQSKKK